MKKLTPCFSAAFFIASSLLTPIFSQESVSVQERTQLPKPEISPFDSGISQMTLADLEKAKKLMFFVGQSLLVQSPRPLLRVSISDPQIASALIISPRQVLIHGKASGKATLFFWDERENSFSVELEVQLEITVLQETVDQIFPEENVDIVQLKGVILLKGEVFSERVSEQVAALVQSQAAQVVNLLEQKKRGEVLLQVRFAEVNRVAARELGFTIFSTGAANTPGVITTEQFGDTIGNAGAIPQEVEGGGDVQAPNVVSGGIGNRLQASPAVIGLSDLLNVFVFRPDLNLGAAIRALERRNLLQILAEPNLLALDGEEASFLAGGEFPFPVVQGGTNLAAVTIQFKEFGIRLTFTPTILQDGKIRLMVTPEVSALDFANALTVSGFLVPALSTRKASTEIELNDGQSFAIAGLIDNRLTEVASKIPVLGDIPLIGRLFRSKSLSQSKTELLVVVTPRLVKKLPPGELPLDILFPTPFMDEKKFDQEFKRKSGENKKEGESGQKEEEKLR